MSAGDRGDSTLGALLRHVEGVRYPEGADDLRIAGVTTDSREVRPGDLFVAIPGTREDGLRYADDAVRQGAAAVVTGGEEPVDGAVVVRVRDPRQAVAELAAAWWGWPARALPLVGITGTFGKTSVLAMLDAMLARAGWRAGAVGSTAVGVRLAGELVERSRLTTPDPLSLHRDLARMREDGAELVALEVTSQGLEQRRVHGLRFQLGIFTTLVPLEHSEYHPTFRDYVEAKRRFFDHMVPGAPLLYGMDNLALRGLVEGAGVRGIGCGVNGAAGARIADERLSAEGTRFRLEVAEPLPGVGGAGGVDPCALDIELRLLGRPALVNAALAAVAALCLGVAQRVVRDALAALPPPSRRIEVVHRAPFLVLDDTAGHPDSVSATFGAVERLSPRRVHVLCGVRGGRGAAVNQADAEALAVWVRRLPVAKVVVTSSRDTADPLDRADAEEIDAFVGALRRDDVAHRFHAGLEDAAPAAMDGLEEGDLLLLLGAQGMDRAWQFVRGRLEAAGLRPQRGGQPTAVDPGRGRERHGFEQGGNQEMIQIELSEQEAGTLREMLEDWLGDLRMEISKTDRQDFREGLKRREELLKRVIADLRAKAT